MHREREGVESALSHPADFVHGSACGVKTPEASTLRTVGASVLGILGLGFWELRTEIETLIHTDVCKQAGTTPVVAEVLCTDEAPDQYGRKLRGFRP